MKIDILYGGPSVQTQVRLDGKDIADALTGLEVTMASNTLPKVTLDLFVLDSSGSGLELLDPEIVVPEPTRAVLVYLGWTPPSKIQDTKP